MKDPKPVLDERHHYFGDNGRLFCGRLKCAGASAYFSGRGISGQPVERVTPADVRHFDSVGLVAKCESCGREASRLEVA